MKKALALVMATVMALGLVACGGNTTTSGTTSSANSNPASGSVSEANSETEKFDTVDLRVAYMPNMGSCSLVATAKEKGFFEEMGLNVTLTEFQGGPAEIAAMASGDIDIAQIGHGAHALCIEGKAKIFQLDCTSLADAVMVNTEKGIEKLEDLKGKTIATTAGTSAEIILDLALESVGLSQKDCKIVEMDANGMVAAMISGNIDACATWSPSTVNIQKAMGDKVKTLATNNDYLDKATFPSSMITTEKFAAENRDVLVRFTRAIQKAADYRAANIEEVAGMVAKQCKVDKQAMLDCVGEGNWVTGKFVSENLDNGVVKSYYENQQKIFMDSGKIKEQVPVENYVMFDIMKEAAEANAK